jgi:hypothetical protein
LQWENNRMDSQPPHVLDYAPAPTRSARELRFTWLMTAFAVAGLVVNTLLIQRSIEAVHDAQWAYRQLTQNPRAFFREIDPVVIASLKEPRDLWVGAGLMSVAAAFGLMLAVLLLRSVWQLHWRMARGDRGMRLYRRLKPFGVIATAIGFFAFGVAHHEFWVAATRHNSLGSGPPFLETVMLALGGLTPWWLVGVAVKNAEPLSK